MRGYDGITAIFVSSRNLNLGFIYINRNIVNSIFLYEEYGTLSFISGHLQQILMELFENSPNKSGVVRKSKEYMCEELE